MKNKFLKNKIVLVAVMILLGSFSIALAAPGDAPSRPPVNPGNSSQPVLNLKVGGSNLPSAALDVAGSNALSLFDKIDSFITVFGRLWVGGNTWLGLPSLFSVSSTDPLNPGLIPLPIRALNIAGTFLSSTLSHDGTIAAQRPVCAQNSKLILCSAPAETYQWSIDAWSPCAGSCTGTYMTSGSSYSPGTFQFASCFIADTVVLMADGTTKKIQDVKIGDVLKGQKTDNTVLGFHNPKLGNKKLYSFNGGEYFVTAEHPFMTTEGWKAFDPKLAMQEHKLDIYVGQLAVGDTLVTANGNIRLNSVSTKTDKSDTQLYNFILNGDNTYYADGYLVHNKNITTCTGNDVSNCETYTNTSACVDHNNTGLLIASGTSMQGKCAVSCTSGGQIPTCGAGSTGSYCDTETGLKKCLYNNEPAPTNSGPQPAQCSTALLDLENEEASCESYDGCSWNSSSSTQTRAVVCVNSSGVTVADSFCVAPKPATTQACSGGVVVTDPNLCETSYNLNGQWYPLPGTYQEIPSGAYTCFSCAQYPANGVCN